MPVTTPTLFMSQVTTGILHCGISSLTENVCDIFLFGFLVNFEDFLNIS